MACALLRLLSPNSSKTSLMLDFALSNCAATVASVTSWQLNALNVGVVGVSAGCPTLVGLLSEHPKKNEHVPNARAINLFDLFINTPSFVKKYTKLKF
jgi:hypothetical protein